MHTVHILWCAAHKVHYVSLVSVVCMHRIIEIKHEIYD